MKTLNVVLEDEAYAALERAKGALTWREFLAKAAKELDETPPEEAVRVDP